MQGVKPLEQDRIQPRKPKPAPRRHSDVSSAARHDDAPFENLFVETGSQLSWTAPGVQKTVMRRLKQGKFPVRAELDLHGLFAQQAEREIRAFISEASARGLGCVRIIHGKGRDGPGILKQKTNSWLRQMNAVKAFCSCKPEDGGTGAVYVLLRQEAAPQKKPGHR